MCGILAVSAPRGSAVPIDPTLAAIRHRGPDDQGTYVSEQADCHLGHVRLSILDLSCAGHQPMSDRSGRFFVTYNGEIYNFRDLQRELEARHGPIPWRSATDTEVIVEGFAREGVPFLRRLNGIFALAIWDAGERTLHVLRDPVGIKPLFVTEQAGRTFFCSELKGLLAVPGLKRVLRLRSLADQLAFMYIPEPHTLFHGFSKVEPGCCFSYREGRLVASRRLFNLEDAYPEIADEHEAVERFRTALAAAVQQQLVSDVPVSLFLSGGIDSSALAVEVVRCGGNIRDAYTIASTRADRRRDPQGDDLHFALDVAQRLGLQLHVITASPDFATRLPELIRFMEDGFTDPAAINTYLICAAARESGVKVMLSGQGADEYLGGYRRYLAEAYFRRMPAALRKGVAAVARLVPRTLPDTMGAAGRRVARVAGLAGMHETDRLLGLYTWTTRETIHRLFTIPGWWAGGEEVRQAIPRNSRDDPRDAMMRLDQKYDLMSLNLCYTDRMSMAVGVEARVPYLDLEFLRVVQSLPFQLKFRGRVGKYVLRKAMEGSLPDEILRRDKAGFGLPIRAWTRGDQDLFRSYLDSGRLRQQGIFDPATIAQLLREERSGVADHANTLFTLLCQQVWLSESGVGLDDATW